MSARELNFFLLKAEQIITRLNNLAFFEEEKTYLDEELIFTLQPQMTHDFLLLKSLFENASKICSHEYYVEVLIETNFYKNVLGVWDYYNYHKLIKTVEN